MWIILAALAHLLQQPRHQSRVLSRSESEGVGETAGVRPWDSRPITKLWVKSSCRSPIASASPITQKPWLWTPLPLPKMTQPPVLAPVRQRFSTTEAPYFLLLFLPPQLPECFKAAPPSRISEQCRLKGGSSSDMTARRNSECHSWHIPHPFGVSSPFFWTPDWFWQPILGVSYEREFWD